MPSFTIRLSLSGSSYPSQFHCAHNHGGELHMIDFNSNSSLGGTFAPGRNCTIELPKATFDDLACHVNAGHPEVTIVTDPGDKVTDFDPGNQPSLPLSLGDASQDMIWGVYVYTDPATWAPTEREIDFINCQDDTQPPSGTFIVGQNSSICLPPASMTKLNADLASPGDTIISIQTDPVGSVIGFNSSTVPAIPRNLVFRAARISKPGPKSATRQRVSAVQLVHQRAVVLPERNKPINDFCIRGLVDRRADLRRFIELTIINTGDRRARTRGKFVLGNGAAYCRLSRKRFGRVRELLSRTHKNVALSVVVSSSGSIIDVQTE